MQEEPSDGVGEALDINSEFARPRLIAILFCDWANQTIDDKANLIGIFDRILMAGRSSVTPIFTLFIRLAQVTDGPVHLRIIDPSGKLGLDGTIQPEHVAVNEKEATYVQLIAPMQFEAAQAGIYWFDVSYQGKSLGAAPLVVEKLEKDDPRGKSL